VANSKRAISTVGERYRRKGRVERERERERERKRIKGRTNRTFNYSTSNLFAVFVHGNCRCAATSVCRGTCSRAKIYDKRVARIESSFVRVLHATARDFSTYAICFGSRCRQISLLLPAKFIVFEYHIFTENNWAPYAASISMGSLRFIRKYYSIS